MSDDFAAGIGTTGAVVVGGEAMGNIEVRGDRDWFAVTLEAGTTYRIDLEGASSDAGTLADPHLRGIYDAGGNLINDTTDNNGGTGKNSRVYFTATADATYYVAAAGNGASTGTYTLSVTEAVDDRSSDTDTTGTVAVGGTVAGDIETTGDRDWFAVDLVAETAYRIDLKGASTGDGGSLHDPYLHGIYDADGALIDGTSNNDSGVGRNSRLHFTPTESGTYYVAAGANGDGKGTYVLTVAEGSDDYSDDSDTTGVVGVGSPAVGRIENPGDRDWFAVELVAGRGYRIYLEGTKEKYGVTPDPYLHGVYDSESNWYSNTWDDLLGYGYDSLATFTPTESGTYYISAGYARNKTGGYTLTLREYDDDYAATVGTTGTVAVGSPTTGSIDEQLDADWFAVELEAGQLYRFTVQGGPKVHTLYDSDGNEVSWPRITQAMYRPPETETYYVSVRNISKYDWNAPTYTLSVEEMTDGM